MATIVQKSEKKILKTNGTQQKSEETEFKIYEGHLPIQKTYKLYIGGKFPRTESGRFFQLKHNNRLVANMCQSSRKDFRNAVKAARSTFASDWSKRAPFNRGHIMYRIAEMLETRRDQFVLELTNLGVTKEEAERELDLAIDRLIYYAGWADKYQQIFSSVNTVSTPHFNFSMYEPTGVVAVIAPDDAGLLGLISTIIPAIVGGNVVIVVPSSAKASLSITFAEVLHTSDVTGGVVNVLTGFPEELAPHMSTHMDVNAIVYAGNDQKILKLIQENASMNLKRVIHYRDVDWFSEKGQSPYYILDTQELKTTWHPIGF